MKEMGMTPKSPLLLDADEDGVGVSLRPWRTSKITALLLRLPAASSPPRCDSFHESIPHVYGRPESSKPPMKRRKITVCEEASSCDHLSHMAIDIPGSNEQSGLTGMFTVNELRPASLQLFPVPFDPYQVCEEADNSTCTFLIPVAINLPGTDQQVVINDQITISEPTLAQSLAFPIRIEPSLFWDGIKISSYRFTVQFDSRGVQHVRCEYCDCEDVVGVRLQHMVLNTCALDAAALCVEAQHRHVYESLHGRGSFPGRAASLRELRRSCERKGIWSRKYGALAMGPVLQQIITLGGIRMTNSPSPSPRHLPLRSWEEHLPDGLNGTFTEERLADLMDDNGPFIGVIRYEPWYSKVDADVNPDKVYQTDFVPPVHHDPLVNLLVAAFHVRQQRNERHAVLCCRYRNNTGTGMDVMVVDNKRRWVRLKEFLQIYTLQVEPMDPKLFEAPHIRYPLTGA